MYRALTVLAFTLLALPAFAQTAPVEIKPLRDNVYWVPGGPGRPAGGTNSGVIIGTDGVVVIDAKQSPDAARDMFAQIATLTDKPVKNLLLLGNGENAAGLAGVPAGITVISNAEIRAALQKRIDAKSPAAPPPDRLPSRLISGERTLLTLNGVRLVVLHIAPTHTSGEMAVYLPDSHIAFTGYVLQPTPAYPIIHPDQNGSALGWIKFMHALLELDADKYVIAAGDIWTRAQMQQRLDAQEAVVSKIRAMVADGKTKEDVRKALGSYDVLPGRPPQIYFFSEVAYDEIAKGMK